jgi:hypothetical protein
MSSEGTGKGEKEVKTWIKVLIVTLVVAVPTVPLGQLIWPPNPAGPQPAGAQLPLFIVLAVIESLLLGLGVSFVAFGLPLLQRAGRSNGLTWAAFVSIAWLMMSWWPHDGFHRSLDHTDLNGLLTIEYGFHVTLMIASTMVGLFFVRTLGAKEAVGSLEAQAARPAGFDTAHAETR